MNISKTQLIVGIGLILIVLCLLTLSVALVTLKYGPQVTERLEQTEVAGASPNLNEVPFNGKIVYDCPEASLGYHPDNGEPLIFEMYPFPGDTNVLCKYEVLDLEQEVKIELSSNVVAIVADWSHGTYNDDGTLKDACPTGWKCEGVWVATHDFIVPAGTLVNLHVYIREQPAKQRFAEIISWKNADGSEGSMDPFACEYIATQGHSMWNIRVPAWAQDQGEVGTIYGFGLPIGNTNRLTCKGFPIDWEPLSGQLTTK